MRLLVSDTNIFIDMEAGDLLAAMFKLDYQFIVPDVLCYQELEAEQAYLLNLGLQIRSLSPASVARVQALSQIHLKAGRNDLFALVLAEA
jgi:hypothetical protein